MLKGQTSLAYVYIFSEVTNSRKILSCLLTPKFYNTFVDFNYMVSEKMKRVKFDKCYQTYY